MYVIRLELADAQDIADAITSAKFEVLVSVDEIDAAFKVKIDGGSWSPPMGSPTDPNQSFTPPF
jgi:hypothetical protein